MAYDEGLAELQRTDLGGRPGLGTIAERKMFGGIAFLLDDHMVCGVHSGGAMYRVGKARHDTALTLDGVGPMVMGSRTMGGWVDVDDAAMADERTRLGLTDLALANVAELPPK